VLRRLRNPLFPFEWLALLSTVAVVVFLQSRGLRVGWRAFSLTVPPMARSLPAILATGLLLQAITVAARRESVRGYLREFARPASLLLWLRICVAFMLVTFSYAWLKVSVPLVHHTLWDGELWRLDRALHLGAAPNVFLVELFAGSPLLGALDRWYALWIGTVFVAWAWAAAHPSPDRRRSFALACGLLSIAGSWLYLALPALGPCFAFPELFAPVREELPRASGVQAALAANYAKLLAGRDGTLRQFNPYLGVAAMPSLHVGAHWLFALWSRRHARSLFWPCVAATALTFLGSVVTGWHYAVDGYAGILLAWGVSALAERLEPAREIGDEAVAATPTPVAELPSP
jgi:hypothetical protein